MKGIYQINYASIEILVNKYRNLLYSINDLSRCQFRKLTTDEKISKYSHALCY